MTFGGNGTSRLSVKLGCHVGRNDGSAAFLYFLESPEALTKYRFSAAGGAVSSYNLSIGYLERVALELKYRPSDLDTERMQVQPTAQNLAAAWMPYTPDSFD